MISPFNSVFQLIGHSNLNSFSVEVNKFWSMLCSSKYPRVFLSTANLSPHSSISGNN